MANGAIKPVPTWPSTTPSLPGPLAPKFPIPLHTALTVPSPTRRVEKKTASVVGGKVRRPCQELCALIRYAGEWVLSTLVLGPLGL